jgi:hemoglobin/transferrin/lactoferrin receptor protein
MVFQSRNIADARIYGAELKAGVDFGQISPTLQGWALRSSVAWSRGDNKTDDTPLDSVDPLRGTVGLMYDTDAWGVELAGTFVKRKDRVASATVYRPAGYGVADLMAHWNFAPGATFNVGVFNLGDKRYIDWSNVGTTLSPTSRVLDRYTSPGRTFSASLAVSW